MTTLFGGNLHAGLAGLDLQQSTFELGAGITLSKTYAHLMAPFMVAVNPPLRPGSHHPGPWKAVRGDFSFDVQAELFIPYSVATDTSSTLHVARVVLFLLRLGVNPATTLPVFSDFPFSQLSRLEAKAARLFPFEVQQRFFPLGVESGEATSAAVEWVADRWQITRSMMLSSKEFETAIEALDSVQFVRQRALGMVSLWGALEALFSPAKAELRFRVSANIAAFLEEPGPERLKLQKAVAKLYDKRSAAAHGSHDTDADDLLATCDLIRRVLLKIIELGSVPTQKSLEEALFGVPSTCERGS